MLLFLQIFIFFFTIIIVRKFDVFLKMSFIMFVYDIEKPCNFFSKYIEELVIIELRKDFASNNNQIKDCFSN